LRFFEQKSTFFGIWTIFCAKNLEQMKICFIFAPQKSKMTIQLLKVLYYKL